MTKLPLAVGALLLSLLAACGGGGGGGSGNPPPPPPPPAPTPPSGLSYASPQVFTVNVAIAALNPTVTGTPTSYSVSPALAAGLALNSTTGSISGTPTAPQTAANYTVTATNAGGNTTAVLSIAVNDIAPVLAYPSATLSLTTGVPVAAIAPIVGGGVVVGWSVSPALPAGLTFNTSTGVISGTPTTASAATTHVVTAQNSGGSDTFDLSLSVQSAVVLQLGHSDSLFSVTYSGQRIFSLDNSRHAVLWNAQTSEILMTGTVEEDRFCDIGCAQPHTLLAGSVALLRRNTGWDVYSSVDGAFIRQIPTALPAFSTLAKLPTDGSYILIHNASRFAVYSPDGTELLTRTGDFSGARFFAAPGEIRIATGPAGAQVIEYVGVNGSATTSPAFAGAFHAWFDDGARFFTRAGNTIRVYSSAGVQEDLSALPTVAGLRGMGNWFWTLTTTGSLSLYAVGSSATPTQTYSAGTLDNIAASGNTLAILPYGSSTIGIVDLSGATPVRVDYASPISGARYFAALSSSDWVFGNSTGVLLGELNSGPPQRYSLGKARAFAGSSTRVALATSDHRILIFNAATRALEGEIPFSSGKLKLSADGSVLAALADASDAQYRPDRSVRVYSLPSRTLLKDWPATFGGSNPWPFDISLSADGQVVGRTIGQWNGAFWTISRNAVRLDDTVLWSDVRSPFGPLENMPVRLTSTGARIAAPDNQPSGATGTNIFTNGVLTGAAVGWPVGWIDDNRLLINRFTGTVGNANFAGADIVDPTGLVLSSPAIGRMNGFQALGGNQIYSSTVNVILDATTGNTIWSSAASASGAPVDEKGAVGGGYVFFSSAGTVRAEPR